MPCLRVLDHVKKKPFALEKPFAFDSTWTFSTHMNGWSTQPLLHAASLFFIIVINRYHWLKSWLHWRSNFWFIFLHFVIGDTAKRNSGEIGRPMQYTSLIIESIWKEYQNINTTSAIIAIHILTAKVGHNCMAMSENIVGGLSVDDQLYVLSLCQLVFTGR